MSGNTAQLTFAASDAALNLDIIQGTEGPATIDLSLIHI